MSISLDHTQAKKILLAEAAAARSGDKTTLVDAWCDRVAKLGELCPHGKSSTVIAALGTALLAKATDSRVDIYALLDRGEAPDSYSARSLADNVWARSRAALEIDLGANGTNPLNNTPFIGKTRIDQITGVRNREGWQFFLACLEALAELRSSTEIREALRGFILARTISLLPPIEVDPQAGDALLESELIDAIDRYVAEDSEGGRRAQASVAALLDAAFGPECVTVGVINDPDRHAPLDISVTNDEGEYSIAFEVKDKPIGESHVQASIEKTVKRHALRNLAFVAVSRRQELVNFDEVVRWAATRGVKITVFTGWRGVYLACKCFAPATEGIFEGKVYRRLLERACALKVVAAGLDQLRRIVRIGCPDNGT